MSPDTAKLLFWVGCLVFVVLMGWLWTRGRPAYYDDGHVDASGVQPSQAPSRDQITAMVDAAMVEMSNIHPPLRRSECERLIRAALGVLASRNDQQEQPR